MTSKVAKSKPKELTCFVVIGFGRKTDFRTGRTLDLDLTYSKLIKPACDLVTGARINCFRAIDVNKSGSIDKIMYHWLYHADIIIADLSTQNSNVMYELGVRHAQKPNTTIIISEDRIFESLPFDLSHTVIHSYEHLGEEIADEVAEKFTAQIAGTIDDILKDNNHMDSPIYNYMVGMEPPEYIAPKDRIKELESQLSGQGTEAAAVDPNNQAVSIFVKQAEMAKKKKQWDKAIKLIDDAIKQLEETSPDESRAQAVSKEIFLYQRKALLTYKQSEDNLIEDEKKNNSAIGDLHAALAVLAEADDPLESNDPETLGLSGAINKRLWERTGETQYLDLSILFYERGFYIAQDYYNGINVAYMYSVKSDVTKDIFNATVFYGHASLLREKVAEICEKMRKSEAWISRGDKIWVLLSLAEAYYASDQQEKANKLMPECEGICKATEDKFAMDAYEKQRAKLVPLLERFKARRTADGGVLAAGVANDTDASTTISTGAANAQVRADGAIIIDLGPSSKAKSIDVQVKVDY